MKHLFLFLFFCVIYTKWERNIKAKKLSLILTKNSQERKVGLHCKSKELDPIRNMNRQ